MKMNRRTMLGAGVAATALMYAGDSARAQTPVAADAFPVEMEHVYGTTTIEAAPERVIALGWTSYDVLIALDIVPIAMAAQIWGGDEDGYYPWTREAIGDRELPALLDTGDGLPFEEIILLEPDLILAPYAGYSEEEYTRLAEIAPTVVHNGQPWTGSWQEITTIVGTAVGKLPEAEALIESTEAYVAQEAARYSNIAGKSFLYGTASGSETAFAIYVSRDPRALFMESLGMVHSDFQAEADEIAGELFSAEVSHERARDIVADVVVFWFTNDEEYAAVQENQMFQLIPAVAEGRFAPIIGESYVMATSAFSPLSIPFALEAFLPAIDEAAANV